MKSKKDILFISYDGMTDPLGQSQVIPYLRELSKLGYKIDILSTEKQDNYLKNRDYIKNLLKSYNIGWHKISYTKTPPVLSTIKDIYRLKKTASKLFEVNQYEIIHCRSYISAFVGHYLKQKHGTKFLFDIRGFYADERVDGNLWPQSKLIYRLVYKYFKKKEKDFFLAADYTISLTHAGKKIMLDNKIFEKMKIEVIPCCADINLFNYHNIKAEKRDELKNKINISDNDYVLTYLGSVGTWYMLDEMMQFFTVLKEKYNLAKFLFITRESETFIKKSALKNSVNTDDVIVYSALRDEVPNLISLSDASIFFIKPLYSKKSSSPTKLAELLGMGIPIICNSNVGDVDSIVGENNLGIVIDDFTFDDYKKAVDKIESLKNIDKSLLRDIVEQDFSLDVGVKKYNAVYKKLIDN